MPRTHPRRFVRAALLPLFVLGAVPVSAAHLAAPHLPVPAESFLNYHAGTVGELSDQVAMDPQVRARLSKHFHVSQAQMMTYVHRNLVLRHLQKAGTYRVACVRRDGSEYWIESRLPAGTPVFASRATGKPILKLACGNPMVLSLPPTVFPNKPIAPPKLAAVPVTMAASDLAVPPVLTAIDGTQTDLVVPADLTAPPVVRVSPSLQLLGGGGSSGLGSIFPALLGAGAAVAVFGNNSGGGSTPNIPVLPAVPEASSVTSFGLLLVGSSLLFILRRKTAAKSR